MKKAKEFLRKFWQMSKRPFIWYKGLYRGKPWWKKTLLGIVSAIVFFFLYLGAVDINFLWLFGKSPGWAEISEHKTSEASELYSADGVLLGKYFNENRTPVEYEEVNPVFWKALIDTEDERFFNHWGIDPMGMLGAAKDAATGKGGRGASTITQQLAKNMFRVRTQYSTGLLGYIPGVKMLIMKTKEWILATKLELYFACTEGRERGKKEILVNYANTVDFGNNAFGIKTACKTYFNTTPKKLKIEEAAVLVGMLKATTTYNPVSHPEKSKERRNQVLENMCAHGHLTRQQTDSLKKRPIDVSEFNVEDNYDGQAKYFREAINKHIKQLAEDNDALKDIDLYNDGLKIYTTLDTRMQKYAEQAVAKQMRQVQNNFNAHWKGEEPWQDEDHKVIPRFIEEKITREPIYKYLCKKYNNNRDSVNKYLNKPHKVKVFDYQKGEIEKNLSPIDSLRYMVRFMHCAFVAMEPNTGYVKAWVGDIDFDHWKYDKVTAMRQPGSTFKLFVYSEAMEQGRTPCSTVRDEAISLQVYDKKKHETTTWSPHNANGKFSGKDLPLRSAFAQSVNSVAARLGQDCGIPNIINTAKAMGIKSPLDDVPSLTLGSSDVNLLEMANAYSTIANNGKAHAEAILITKIVNRKGDIIYLAPTETEQAVSERTAFFMQQLLKAGTTDKGGTSLSLNSYIGNFKDQMDYGGKTGTTNNHSDAWFMGVTPGLVVGAWVGGEYRCIHFRTGALGQGSRTALPICGMFLESVMNDSKFRKYRCHFNRPSDSFDSSLYDCGYYEEEETDTIDNDSIDISDEILLDENGNPILPPSTNEDNDPAATPSEEDNDDMIVVEM